MLHNTAQTFHTVLIYLHLITQDLTEVYYWQYMTGFKTIDFTSNNLRKLDGLHALQSARRIQASGNKITNVDCAKMLPYLEELSLENSDG